MSDPATADLHTPMSAEEAEREIELLKCKLAEAHRMASLGRLAAGIVHEINTPIGSILSNNETIRRSIDAVRKLLATSADNGQAPPPKALAMLETLASLTDIDKIACERIYAVIRSLKTFARVNEGDLRTVNIHEILLNTIKLSGCVFRRRITVETQFSDDVPEIECYPALLSQVFLNLIVNASQAIPGEGTVTVRTNMEGPGQVHISVSDTGSGIPPEVQPKIFSAGFTTKPVGEGTGLGLSISREIVEDTHGGHISFETTPGVGTTFHVRIPVRQRSQAAEERS
jgi:two-component system, NtrC family, sensor kinase